ncbi:class I SAM-dependent methyltransferase [Ruegeria sp. 2012CJ41-6]|uniref:Class I SAM-dependent methyltransferase n=1 Tax=Ruegeria spongiae TaxID=2942209 RepID=A0ABT0Q4P9_9RHOB|nr:methyltransferase domain-containing protein [Ruegeria spongiae]MCL6284836.1 class I SAM-dependent methyltransferase [Ruegeria spongiae]
MRLPLSDTPVLFDRSALRHRRQRARADALFLHEAALDEVQDRLSLVKRVFTDIDIVTPFPAIWQATFPQARIIEDDEVLDLPMGASDLVIHAMTLHQANDPVGQIIQCRRALKPDGLFLCVCLGGQTLHELRATLAQAEIEARGGLSPRIAPMAEIRDLGALLQRAGLALPVADSFALTAAYRDLPHLMQDLRAMGETNILSARDRHFTRRSLFEKANRLYSDHFAQPDQRLPATFEVMCLTGWAPDDSQPKPLRPGSATTRLAEALGTGETKLPD